MQYGDLCRLYNLQVEVAFCLRSQRHSWTEGNGSIQAHVPILLPHIQRALRILVRPNWFWPVQGSWSAFPLPPNFLSTCPKLCPRLCSAIKFQPFGTSRYVCANPVPTHPCVEHVGNHHGAHVPRTFFLIAHRVDTEVRCGTWCDRCPYRVDAHHASNGLPAIDLNVFARNRN